MGILLGGADDDARQQLRHRRGVIFHHVLILTLAVHLTSSLSVKEAYAQPKPGCSGKCGNLSIPYPFGTTLECCLNKSFLVNCNHTTGISTTTSITYSTLTVTTRDDNSTVDPEGSDDVQILDISLETHELRALSPVAKICNNNFSDPISTSTEVRVASNFTISTTRNKFTTVGCYTSGTIISPITSLSEPVDPPPEFANACGSFCTRIEDVKNGSCRSNDGCCQTPIPKNLYNYSMSPEMIDGYYINRSMLNTFNPCVFSFVVEEDAFNFSSSDLWDLGNTSAVPVVLDWAVGNVTCEEAQNKSSNSSSLTYACHANYSECHDSSNGYGYQCRCMEGYAGNPYLHNGCQDINECEVLNPCKDQETCNNLPGNFSCSCPKRYNVDGMSCSLAKLPYQTPLAIALAICISFLVTLVGGIGIYWRSKRRKLIRLKERFFEQNGGILLQEQLSNYKGSMEMTKIFTEEELKKATNNFDESKVVGRGGYGTVYKGVLSDTKVVAIKKSTVCDQTQIEQFINEVILLSRINHRNVVKLLGCCLETQVPLLVYEFITNGTLSSHVHGMKLPWKLRLKIATETAGALAYLHSEASMPIIHRDVKTSNILLDDNYTAKVSDFGASRLIPLGQTTLTTLVKGTVGYLDPQYFQSSQLTEKSDVYSFGVVLAELLTGKEAVFFEQSRCIRTNLAKHFICSMAEDRLLEILDDQMDFDVNANEEVIEQLKEVAGIAAMCLREKGEDRPSTKDVASELEGLMNTIGINI